MSLQVLTLCGSLRNGSTNDAVLRTAELLMPTGVTATRYARMAELPHFNPDDDRDPLDPVVADLRDNSAYWAAFEGPVNDAAQKVYDSFLKSSGDPRGTQSYGTVVDMLMAYYG